MWVARVLGRSDEYMRRRTSLSCKAVNSKKLLPALVQKQVAFAMLLVAVHLMFGPGDLAFVIINGLPVTRVAVGPTRALNGIVVDVGARERGLSGSRRRGGDGLQPIQEIKLAAGGQAQAQAALYRAPLSRKPRAPQRC